MDGNNEVYLGNSENELYTYHDIKLSSGYCPCEILPLKRLK